MHDIARERRRPPISRARESKWDYDALAMDRFISDDDRGVSPDTPGSNQSSFCADKYIRRIPATVVVKRTNTRGVAVSLYYAAAQPSRGTRPKSKDRVRRPSALWWIIMSHDGAIYLFAIYFHPPVLLARHLTCSYAAPSFIPPLHLSRVRHTNNTLFLLSLLRQKLYL